MKVRCPRCKVESDDSEWKEIEFYCDDCLDDHSGHLCPTPECYFIEGPGAGTWEVVTP